MLQSKAVLMLKLQDHGINGVSVCFNTEALTA